MVGVNSTNALKALIYKKQLKMSNATNKQFKTGEIINFVQSDASKLYFLSGFLPIIA
jgi:UTP-glucose-1-phosphate uridylyltransferase